MMMQKTIALVIISISCIRFTCAQELYTTQLSSDQLREDLVILRKNLEEVHPGLYTYFDQAKFAAAFQAIERKIQAPTTIIEFYRSLLPLNPLIANVHTIIKAPESYQKALQEELLRIPLRLYIRNDSVFVLEDARGTEFSLDGQLIQKINGLKAIDFLHNLAALQNRDGFNLSLPLYRVSQNFSWNYACTIGTPDHIGITYYNHDQKLISQRIECLPSAIILENLKEDYGAVNQYHTKRFNQEYALKFHDDIAMLSIPSFQPEGKGASKGYKSFIRESFNKFLAEETQHLIIDLRGNGGGFPEAAYYLFSFLIDHAIQPIQEEYTLVKEIPDAVYFTKDHFFKHFNKLNLKKNRDQYVIESSAGIQIKPHKSHFDQQIYVLTDARTASAAGDFTGLLKSYTNAIFVGEEPGGNPGNIAANDLLELVLPNSKIRIQLPAVRTIAKINFAHKGRGVSPDFPMKATIKDKLEFRDFVLGQTIHKIKTNSFK